MTDSGIDLVAGGTPPPRRAGSRRAEKPRGPRWGRWIVLLIVVVLVGVGGKFVYDKAQDVFGGPEDYTGQGTGEVVVDIPEGSTGGQIAQILFDAGVVKSSEAFYDLAVSDSRAASIEAGSYTLRREMSAAAALDALTDRANRAEGKITIPEGARIGFISTRIAETLEVSEDEVTAALADPVAIGLPDYAMGNPEGFLFPATYPVRPGATPTEVIAAMVAKTVQVTESLDIEARAATLGLTAEEVLTVASILEYEAKREEDYAKVARVLYNRLDIDMKLQLDSTVSFVTGRKGDVFTTPEEREIESPYNTYYVTGLPPGPIGAAGEKTIEAALNPADGDWTYFVAVNLETGETVFSDNKDDHDRATLVLQEYCRGTDIC